MITKSAVFTTSDNQHFDTIDQAMYAEAHIFFEDLLSKIPSQVKFVDWLSTNHDKIFDFLLKMRKD